MLAGSYLCRATALLEHNFLVSGEVCLKSQLLLFRRVHRFLEFFQPLKLLVTEGEILVLILLHEVVLQSLHLLVAEELIALRGWHLNLLVFLDGDAALP